MCMLFGCNSEKESYLSYDAKINNKNVPYYGFEIYGEDVNLQNNEYISKVKTGYKEYNNKKNGSKFIYRDYLDGVEIIKNDSMKSVIRVPEKINGKKVIKLGGYIDTDLLNNAELAEDYSLSSCFISKAIVEEIYIPKYVKEIIKNTFEDIESLKRINVDKANPYYTSKNGVLYDKSGKIKLFTPKNEKVEYIE